MTPPNIVLILMDDLGYGDLSCYNPDSGISTPSIDRLAAEGIRFTQFYATSNICSPSRRALLTGRYQSRLGEWAEAYHGTPTCDAISGTDEPCFAQYLKRTGYATGSFGKWNIGEVNGVSTPDAQGFDTWIGSFHNHSYFGHRRDNGTDDFWENGELAPQYAGQYSDDVFIDKAIDFIRANRANPFFVYLPLCTPHAPFQDPADPVEGPEFAWWNEKSGGKKDCNLPREQQRPLLTRMVEHVDRRIGDLLAILTELGLDENTMVLFSSDNGGTPASINAPLRGHKQGMLDGGIRVPAIAKWPGVYPEGVVSHQVGILTDFSRTIVEAAGAAGHADPERPFDGIDLTPILSGACPEQKRELGWRRREWRPDPGGWNNVWAEAYIKGDWKYIREFKEAPPFARSVDGGYPDAGFLELLYNLSDDVHEDRNLAQDAPGKLAELRAAFEDWKTRTVDPDHHYRIPFPDQYSRSSGSDQEQR
ncbi:MAG: sulfatase-like hydrolase/transferase [Lentisphaerae bacterium]|nr:sulfatase-like hydrolase/transferase [Lentisphaerota bacterium]